jgi:hypothetical protein
MTVIHRNVLSVMAAMEFVCAGYATKLLSTDKIRYLSKINVCGFDPYESRVADFSKDTKLWPKVEYADIVNYLVLATSHVSTEQMKAYKSLESYNFFTSGFVDPAISSKKLGDGRILVIAKVRLS